MQADPERVYIDSCVLLAYICGEPKRAADVEAVLDEAEREQLELITSVITIGEVLYGAARGGVLLDPGVESQIDALWEPASPITLVDVTAAVAVRAREVRRDALMVGRSVPKLPDAIHLASAMLSQCDRLFTYETKRRRILWRRWIGIPVEGPSVAAPRLDLG